MDELRDDAFLSAPFGGPSSREEAMTTQINLVKVFSATKAKDRERLGDRVNDWIAANPTVQIVRTSVTQSSDAAFHCLTFVLFGAAVS